MDAVYALLIFLDGNTAVGRLVSVPRAGQMGDICAMKRNTLDHE
jgi:hypothetical protein